MKILLIWRHFRLGVLCQHVRSEPEGKQTVIADALATQGIKPSTCFVIFTKHIPILPTHYSNIIVDSITSQITSLTIVYSSVYSGADQRRKSKLRVTGLCAGNSPETGAFPAQKASNVENVSIWWRHHDLAIICKERDTTCSILLCQ